MTDVLGDHLAPAHAFALLLETACENFRILQSFMLGEITLVTEPPQNQQKRILFARAQSVVMMALAKSFVTHIVRSRRICEDGAKYLKVDPQERRAFLTGTKALVRVRDVNEHGFDVKKNYSRP